MFSLVWRMMLFKSFSTFFESRKCLRKRWETERRRPALRVSVGGDHGLHCRFWEEINLTLICTHQTSAYKLTPTSRAPIRPTQMMVSDKETNTDVTSRYRLPALFHRVANGSEAVTCWFLACAHFSEASYRSSQEAYSIF